MIGSVTQVQQAQASAEKGRRKRERRDLEMAGHDPADEPLTSAHAAAEAELQAARDDDGHDARKAYQDRGITDGPGSFTEPHMPAEPGTYGRPYLDDGHAAASPMHQGPNVSPLPPQGRGILEPVLMPGLPELAGHNGPVVQAMAKHSGRAAETMPRMPIPTGAA